MSRVASSDADNESCRIVGLVAENFKRISAVRLKPGPGLNVVAGRNAQGKSSVLDAIAAALGGKSATPPIPIREGRTRAQVVVDLGDLVVERVWTGNGRTALVVRGTNGEPVRSPQAILDSLVGRLTFDPLEFVRSKPAEQASILRELAGLDTTALDRERATVYADRTAANREVDRIKSAVAALPHHPDAPATAVSVAALTDELLAAQAVHKALEDVERRREDAERYVAMAAEAVERARAELERAETTLTKRQDEADAVEREYEEAIGRPLPDLDAIRSRLGAAESLNRQVSANATRAREQTRLDEAERVAWSLDERIAAIDAQRRAKLEAARLPLPGLEADGQTVLYHGRPLQQASQAEQLRVGLAIGAALNPTLRVVLVRDGSLLDDEAMEELAAWSEEVGLQVFLERVGKHPGAVVIEDGHVAEDPTADGESDVILDEIERSLGGEPR